MTNQNGLFKNKTLEKLFHVYLPSILAIIVVVISYLADTVFFQGKDLFSRSGAILILASLYVAFHQNKGGLGQDKNGDIYVDPSFFGYNKYSALLGVIGTLIWAYGSLLIPTT